MVNDQTSRTAATLSNRAAQKAALDRKARRWFRFLTSAAFPRPLMATISLSFGADSASIGSG